MSLPLAMVVFLAPLGAQDLSSGRELVQEMIRIVTTSNPSLLSQERLVRTGESLPEPRSGFAVAGASTSLGSRFWNPDDQSFELTPGVAFGLSFTFSDPARTLNGYTLAREKEDARQKLQEIRNRLVEDLIGKVEEISRLANKRAGLQELSGYLQELAGVIEQQGQAGIIEPGRMWELHERIMGIQTEMQDVENRLKLVRLEAAMELGGEAWPDLLALLERVGAEL